MHQLLFAIANVRLVLQHAQWVAVHWWHRPPWRVVGDDQGVQLLVVHNHPADRAVHLQEESEKCFLALPARMKMSWLPRLP